jgi:hypothetical protein
LGFQFGFERGEAWVAVALDCHCDGLGLGFRCLVVL